MHFDWYLRAGLKMRHLRMLALLDHHRQTSKAAAVLNITQPAVSKALSDLEAGLEIRLFERHARGLTPTAAGVALIRCARAMLGMLADAGAELDALSKDVMKPIRIGALPATATSLIPLCLTCMKDIAPSTNIFVREATIDSLVSELRSGGIEIIVGVLTELESYRDLEEEVLFTDRTIFVVRKDHALASQTAIEPAELVQYPWVIPPNSSLLGETLMEWFHASGLPRPTNIVETLSFSVIRQYLPRSDAIATVPSSISVEAKWFKDFHILPIAPETLQRPVGMSWYRDRPETSGMQLFKECMRRIVADHALNAIVD